ncbi:hypothetical protein J1N35_039888 [Gossypium stocksii]|uniref:Uncharacterized protein n=1 Tax=Gossypium stocksii TaxID=47602 RepID=A0A9D3UCJ5_9ROSI|nr:hypothetical protein J1N35_039888 [Gossypium stocksii]
MHAYVEYEVDTPDVVNDIMLLSTTRENDVNIGVGEPNCNEKLNFNEKINGGAGETFTELGVEFNVGPNLVGSSDARAKNEESSESSGTSDTNSSLGSEEALGVESEDEEVRNIKS